ncbi:beta-ketoacyl-[acyl-carrier-protein] synthase family protein [Brenneria tiliae]|uniref:Beta-ketoacyl-[acyl-carrier-protein] synthase family protein n=1 Tax=Brenneria tiliae TaxID=2914984 RepID=A0ABT0MT77_9GAMM|nr:beta-ketoacyl-[acyl-carrier-protein] synthase family protein [Brenneria tiliae]MCL2893050.1 beta-ketoacyl-[acyl-carrier-protein] synthase family protein [Brenneria tiliae]
MVITDSSIWVTGIAWSTALGSEISTVWESLLSDASGITELDAALPLRNNRAASLPDIPSEWPADKRQHELTRATLLRALEDAGIAPDDPFLLAVLGTSFGPHLDMPEIASLSEWSTRAVRDAGCVAAPVTVTTACSAGADAIQAGFDLLKAGAAEVCVCGGADVLTLGKRLSHSRLGTLSPDRLRAFDIRHNGTVLGEGAAFLVLEPAKRAQARGARPYGIIAGAGSSNDAASAVAPNMSGQNVVLAVQRALQSAGITPADVAVVNAHATGTVINDVVEAKAYTQLFADVPQPPAIFATKGAFGHTLGATGAIEAITVLKALETGWVPPVHDLLAPLPDFNLPLPAKNPMKVRSGFGISVTLGFGGFNTCLVFQKLGGTTI